MRPLRLTAVLLTSLMLVAACGDAETSTDSTGSGVSACSGATPEVLTKPAVSLPAELPTTLVITDLTVGSGTAAAVGDHVMVHYVGVRSADGQEFDSNYDGDPFEVSLGAGRVIPGWDQGLVGVQQGGRRQLDIPADLAYGDTPQGDIIQAGDALSFVIDVVAVLPTSDVADEPTVTVEPSANIPVLKSTDLIVGTGCPPVDGQNAAIHIIAYRADTGEKLSSDWGGPPVPFSYSADTGVYPGLLAAVKGMQAGGRRQVQIPYSLMFDGEGNESLGLPPAIDLTVVIDLVAVY